MMQMRRSESEEQTPAEVPAQLHLTRAGESRLVSLA